MLLDWLKGESSAAGLGDQHHSLSLVQHDASLMFCRYDTSLLFCCPHALCFPVHLLSRFSRDLWRGPGVCPRSSRARSCCRNRYLVTLTFAPLERNRGSRAQTHKNSMVFDSLLLRQDRCLSSSHLSCLNSRHLQHLRLPGCHGAAQDKC